MSEHETVVTDIEGNLEFTNDYIRYVSLARSKGYNDEHAYLIFSWGSNVDIRLSLFPIERTKEFM